MSKRIFREMLRRKWDEGKSICVGLDPDPENKQFPESARKKSLEQTLLALNFPIIDATRDLVCAYKPNTAFYEAGGLKGISALIKTVKYIKKTAPDVPIIGDGKRGDIGNTNRGYVRFLFDICGFDATTLSPYMGRKSLEPFLARKEKGIFVLCRTSNEEADEFQGLFIERYRQYLYEYVARRVITLWNENRNCGLVMGATAPRELAEVRQIFGGDEIPILIPGVGARGGNLEATVKAGKNSKGQGMIINSSRATLYASSGPDFAEAARNQVIELQKMSNLYLKGGENEKTLG